VKINCVSVSEIEGEIDLNISCEWLHEQPSHVQFKTEASYLESHHVWSQAKDGQGLVREPNRSVEVQQLIEDRSREMRGSNRRAASGCYSSNL